MANFKLKKGNFFNQLNGSFDKRIIDGNQYDLEVTIKGIKKYYRIRLIDGRFEVNPIILKPEEFFAPNSQENCTMSEISNFLQSSFYHRDFEFKTEFEYVRRYLQEHKVYNNPDYINFLLRFTNKKQLQGRSLYDFRLPAIKSRSKVGVLSYDVSIESSRNYFYTVFAKENAEKGFNDTNKILYSIYSRKSFNNVKSQFEEKVFDICLERNMPLNLISYLYLICDGDEVLINEIYEKIMKAKTKGDIKTILLDSNYKILNPSLIYDTNLGNELENFIKTDKDDINYDFSRKRIQ